MDFFVVHIFFHCHLSFFFIFFITTFIAVYLYHGLSFCISILLWHGIFASWFCIFFKANTGRARPCLSHLFSLVSCFCWFQGEDRPNMSMLWASIRWVWSMYARTPPFVGSCRFPEIFKEWLVLCAWVSQGGKHGHHILGMVVPSPFEVFRCFLERIRGKGTLSTWSFLSWIQTLSLASWERTCLGRAQSWLFNFYHSSLKSSHWLSLFIPFVGRSSPFVRFFISVKFVLFLTGSWLPLIIVLLFCSGKPSALFLGFIPI